METYSWRLLCVLFLELRGGRSSALHGTCSKVKGPVYLLLKVNKELLFRMFACMFVLRAKGGTSRHRALACQRHLESVAEARKHACTIPKGECTEGCRHGRALRVSEHGSLCARVRRKHTHA